ncbi:efflux RND transporter permease subunit [Flammeovirga kamogawensis]|uniref:Efflux RND transporter permease subunit n=1 Tax=Flammeovirga kamogawensis TaxID=373891 RepID=A0ABX8H369_9BACT|nr:efflux RND transporter permease subunit [Flammeovirga kamogawensis]MBB6460195.1 multidrug efflux pump subunit AcrB [Flammeovirga kamogawensis]QWG10007.1 efflux RND transporter permease subunit [Flammeovirga kamogawensis]TRX65515.1 MMPL family transporter [Flammeovirga kamogawensis]
MSIVKSALDNKQIILTITFLIVMYGVYSLLNMPRREDPKFNIREGLIVAAFPGANSRDVEIQVTSKIEDVLFSYEEVNKEKTYSNSREGVLYIVVELQDYVTNADVFWSKLQDKLALLKLSELPSGVIGPIVQSDFGDTIALLVSFQSDKRDSREIKSYIDQLADRLRGIPSLSKIKKLGNKEECYYINIDYRKLSQYKIYTPQIYASLRSENIIVPNGNIKFDNNRLGFLSGNYFSTKKDIENQVVAKGASGQVIRVKDIAEVKRGYTEENQKIRVNGVESILISMEMQNGFNIVDFGDEVDEVIASFKETIPSDIRIDNVVNQPKNVDESISDFIREFFIAIVSVIVVILLLLPFRVALIATLAIPVTVAFTFGILDGLGIQLQQVSLASLIVVLGMLVDDAIVIADNYVEKLEEDMQPYEAAWKSADELKIPVFTAGLTIAGAFLPLIALSGAVGEFIHSLPITVAIAINASYLIAMLLTPYLCYTFIKKKFEKKADGKKNLLDYLQAFFDHAIDTSFKFPKTLFVFSTLSFIVGGSLYFLLKQKLFPAAERDQFVIEIRTKEGASLAYTDSITLAIEQKIKGNDKLKSYASFVGTSSPRFYYNYASKFPQQNLSQILINTTSIEATDEWVAELENSIPKAFPTAYIQVKKMQQGTPYEAPVELRIKGRDLTTIKKIGEDLKAILNASPYSYNVTDDNFENQLSLDIQANKNVANQLGITDATIMRELSAAYNGLKVGSLWEGNTALPIIMQDENIKEKDISAMRNFYITSSITGASVPLVEVATINPRWFPSNIKHRNGIKTLTVQSMTKSDVLPSEIINSIREELDSYQLPEGYSLELGGEDESQRETFEEMNKVIVYCVFIIFLVILIQFKTLNQVAIVLAAIPLSVFGAFFGLLLSGYPFGFTAFVGLASLVGVSVRNSIILVDFANELVIKEGHTIKEAAIGAGKRRIRPIFLTTMAAAIGVTPMIISGSPMWAPLATVLAVGLVFSMFMTLLTIPVLYWKFGETAALKKHIAGGAVLLALFLIPNPSKAQDVITLDQCVEKAKENNQQLQLITLEAKKKQIEVDKVNANYLPTVMLDGGIFWYYHTERTTDVEISINELPVIGGIPPIGLGTEFTLAENNSFIGVANVGVYQPISQLFKIKSGSEVKQIDQKLVLNKYYEAENKIREGVSKLYVGIAIEEAKKEAYDKQIELITQKLEKVQSGVDAGEILDVYALGLNADLLDHESKLKQSEIDAEKYRLQLNTLLNFPQDSLWNVANVTYDSLGVESLINLVQYDSTLVAENYKVKESNLMIEKAEAGLNYHKRQHIPDISLTAQGFYFGNVPLVPQTNVLIGATLSWPILQWGKKSKDVEISKIQLQQAQIQLDENEREVNQELNTKIQELKNALIVLKTAKKALEFRNRELKIKSDAYTNGMLSFKDFADTQEKNLDTKTLILKATSNVIVKEYELRNLLRLENN